jgi:hypothetical protein
MFINDPKFVTLVHCALPGQYNVQHIMIEHWELAATW